MISKTHAAAAAVTAIVLIAVAPMLFTDGADANAAEIKVLCANGMRTVLTELHPQLERTTGQQVTMSFGEAGDLRKRLQEGESADVIVLPRMVLDQVLAQGNLVPGMMVDLAQSAMGIGVRAEAPKPDISAADRLKRLGIAEEVKPKLKLNRGGPNAAFVARGEADMAVQLAHEIRAVPGIAFIPLPAEFQRTIVFSASLASNAKESSVAKALLQFLAGPEAMTVIRAKGMDPATNK